MARSKLCWDENNAVRSQNKGTSCWTGKSSFVLEVPLRYLCPGVMCSVPCGRILQRAHTHDLSLVQQRIVNQPH